MNQGGEGQGQSCSQKSVLQPLSPTPHPSADLGLPECQKNLHQCDAGLRAELSGGTKELVFGDGTTPSPTSARRRGSDPGPKGAARRGPGLIRVRVWREGAGRRCREANLPEFLFTNRPFSEALKSKPHRQWGMEI